MGFAAFCLPVMLLIPLNLKINSFCLHCSFKISLAFGVLPIVALFKLLRACLGGQGLGFVAWCVFTVMGD